MRKFTYAATLILTIGLIGCAPHAAIDQANTMAKVSLITYQKNVNELTETFLAAYRTDHQATADALADAAVRSHVKPDGTADAAAIQAIQSERLRQYADIERVVVSMRSKLTTINRDADGAVTLLAGAEGYWKQQSNSVDMANAASDAAIQLITQYLSKKGKP